MDTRNKNSVELLDGRSWCLCRAVVLLLSMGALSFAASWHAHLPFLDVVRLRV